MVVMTKLGVRRRNKYNNVWTTYNGVSYQSKAEAAYACDLDRCVQAKLIKGWTRQVPFFLGCMENRYVVDFLVVGADGEVWCVDVKGMETPKFNHDKKLWKSHGLFTLVIVKKTGVNFHTTEEIFGGDSEKNAA